MCCNFCDLFGCESRNSTSCPGFVSDVSSNNRDCDCGCNNGIVGGLVAGTSCRRNCCDRNCNCGSNCCG